MYDAEGGPCILEVNKAMLAGEIEYRKMALTQAEGRQADFSQGYGLLKDAMNLSLRLKYNEPWGQMMPVRHALGALLLEQGHVDEALAVYQDDVSMWRNNMWGLLGIKQCLEAKGVRGAELEAATEAFKNASQWADSVPTRTCFCAAKESSCCNASASL
eukprot:TRINITY_DN35981_c0_g1_i1.p2 TRINITY_DN35981_c0_g1~~TRINITY_DN35981_c0_g1_i1.p2  ORF type:complete len:159 (+),score=46.47 TRINITY_DN35981_c0_g1_i1:195-671(+)